MFDSRDRVADRGKGGGGWAWGGIEGSSPAVELVIAQTRALIHAELSRTEQSGSVGRKGQPLQE